jgi:nitroreductase
MVSAVETGLVAVTNLDRSLASHRAALARSSDVPEMRSGAADDAGEWARSSPGQRTMVVQREALRAEDGVVETWDALRARRNVRRFTEQPVPDEALDRILDAGRRAPSAGNWQPWDFVLVTDRTQLGDLAKVWQGAQHVAGAAAAIGIVAPEPQDDRQSALLQYDLGQATYAMTIAAADLGVGTGHAAAADQDQARAVLGFPEGRFLAYVLSVGYPSDKPLAVIERLNRRPFDDVVHRGRW